MIMCLRSPKPPSEVGTARGSRPTRGSDAATARQGGPVFLPRRELSPIARALLEHPPAARPVAMEDASLALR